MTTQNIKQIFMHLVALANAYPNSSFGQKFLKQLEIAQEICDTFPTDSEDEKQYRSNEMIKWLLKWLEESLIESEINTFKQFTPGDQFSNSIQNLKNVWNEYNNN